MINRSFRHQPKDRGQSTSSDSFQPEFSPEQIRNKLTLPSRCLAIVSFISCVTDSIVIWNLLANDMPKMIEDHGFAWGMLIGVTGIVVMLLLIFVHFWIGMAALSMPELKNYTTMRLAASVASIPFVTPIVFLGLPFGLWIYSILRKPSVRAAVESISRVE